LPFCASNVDRQHSEVKDIPQKIEPPKLSFNKFSDGEYYIKKEGAAEGKCDVSSPCNNIDYVLKTYINIKGGDIIIDVGTYAINYTQIYSNIMLNISGMLINNKGSVNENDFNTYPIIQSTNNSSFYVFYFDYDVNFTVYCVTFSFSDSSYNYQNFICSLFY
jgi:hypothetical protein